MKKENFLIIVTDQLTWKALPVYGNTWVKTTNIDRITQNCVAFDECYTPYPLCQPARAAFWSSKYSHEIDVMSNSRRWPVKEVGKETATLGESLTQAGYHAIHFGKTHDSGALHGFEVVPNEQTKVPDIDGLALDYETFGDRNTTEKVVKYFENLKTQKPFAVVADLVNPHNICGFIGAYQGDKENPFLTEPLPPLPQNFTVNDMETRPLAVQYICCSHNRQAEASSWSDYKFRQYLAAYYKYLEMVDAEIGKILDALENSGQKDNTTIIFFADHGDSMVARKRVTKQVDFYEEVERVPFIVSNSSMEKGVKHISGIMSLLDLFPTMCSLVGTEIPENLRGLDVSDAIKGGNLPKRDYVVSQWHTEWGFTVSPARMIRTSDFKYMRYLENNDIELYDIKNDPLEMKNLGYMPEYKETVQKMEAYLQEYIKETADPFETMEVMVDKCWRSHKPGYENHKGLAAPNATTSTW